MKKTLASLLIGLSSVLGNTETPSSMPSSTESLASTRPALDETIFDLGAVKKDIKVREAKIGIKMPDIPLINIGGIELFSDEDYAMAVEDMNKDGGNFYFDKKSRRVFILEGNGKYIRESDGKVLRIFLENGKRVYALDDIARQESVESRLPIDIRGNVGLMDNKFLFKLNDYGVFYRSNDKIVGFNRKFVVVENKDGYFLVDVGLDVRKKIWGTDKREEVHLSDNGRYCLGVLKEEGRFIDVYDVFKGERKYRFIGDLGIKGLGNKGEVRLSNGEVINFRDMNDY